jgi:hypothetical protein
LVRWHSHDHLLKKLLLLLESALKRLNLFLLRLDCGLLRGDRTR